ncbi:hypothetical protein MVI01_61590 [Myxococcus virescens]|uniref:Uncharacterized protein n=1 Tax=Myxococcus virescens TaxID=83456 RepID=A0A511HLU0_9BACT|nr:hypothetical protein MVI01_61590 [Myxococcus virescens]
MLKPVHPERLARTLARLTVRERGMPEPTPCPTPGRGGCRVPIVRFSKAGFWQGECQELPFNSISRSLI